ncbi:MAG: hypothetical protein ACOZJZ_13480 [Pseudomonadota bacterium]
MNRRLWAAWAAALCGSAAAASLAPLAPRDLDALALRAASQVRLDTKEALRMEFHRRQGFRWQGGPHGSADLVSLAAWPPGGGAARCVLAVAQRGQLLTVDALAGDSGQPWSCDGEPALGLADVDGDGSADVLALYPYRPPSNERFMLPLVLRYEPGQGRFVLDAARTAWLRAEGRLPADLRRMKQLLRGYAAAP